MDERERALGEPVARPKWFGVPTGMCQDQAVFRIAEAAGESVPTTVGRIIAVFDWMSQWSPDGRMPSDAVILYIGSMNAPQSWIRKRGEQFTEAFKRETGDEAGYCRLYVKANAATHRSRVRQREQMRKRRGAH